MTNPSNLQLREALADACDSSGVPASSVSVCLDGEILESSYGVTNVETGIPVENSTIFPIGSITKSLTATLTMQFVENNKLDLDEPIARILPKFSLKNCPDAGELLTIRQILSHTSGIDGDLMTDTGDNANAVEELVKQSEIIDLLHPPGALFSYSNFAYNVLGLILEKMSSTSWQDLIQNQLLKPIGLKHYALNARQALRQRAAYGHSYNADESSNEPVDNMFLPRSNGPSGTMLALSARELIRFAQVHMRGGKNEQGEQILSAASVAEMQRQQVQIPLSDRYCGWGLGWMIFNCDGKRLIGHDGGTAGVSSFLRYIPEENIAIALTVNSDSPWHVYKQVMDAVLKQTLGIHLPSQHTAKMPPPGDVDIGKLEGKYERYGQEYELTVIDGKLTAESRGIHVEEGFGTLIFNMLSENKFSTQYPGVPFPLTGYFLDFDERGVPGYLHFTERAFRRLETG